MRYWRIQDVNSIAAKSPCSAARFRPGETRGRRASAERIAAICSRHSSLHCVTTFGVSRTVVYRLVNTLELHRLVRRDSEGRARLGLAVLHYSRRVQPTLRDAALPVLRSLAEDTGATAHLTVADGEEALAIAVIEPSWTDFHVSYRMGSRHALDQGAAGKAILAGRRKPDPAGRPFVVTSGELQAGAQGVSSPVLGVPGVEASIGVVVLGKLDRDFVGPRVARAAVEVAKRLA